MKNYRRDLRSYFHLANIAVYWIAVEISKKIAHVKKVSSYTYFHHNSYKKSENTSGDQALV